MRMPLSQRFWGIRRFSVLGLNGVIGLDRVAGWRLDVMLCLVFQFSV
jgi:hypothetical protein